MKTKLAILNGGKAEQDQKKLLLFHAPENFSQPEFESLCDELQLGLAEVEPLIRSRLRAKGGLERNALLAIIEGNETEAERLQQVIAKRNKISGNLGEHS